MKQFLELNEENMLALIEKLVNIDSGTYIKSGIDRVGEILVDAYEKDGFVVEVHPEEKLGNNIHIRHQEAVNPKVLIIAHLDTVFQAGTALERPFKREGDYAYGPGVIDMKASHATTLFALKALMNAGSEAFKNIELILNTDEEIGSINSRALIEKTAKSNEYALIVEPAQKGALVTARKGGGKYLLKIIGKSAHAGVEPHNGVSAIEELGHKILKLHQLTNREEGINVNVGLVNGGTSINTIAPSAEASIDVRIETYEQASEIDKAIKEICSYSDVAGTTLELSGKITRPPMLVTEGSKKLLRVIQEEGEKLGLELTGEKSGGGSDGNLTSSVGVPTVDGLGPIGGNAHSEDEYLYIPSLTERALLLAKVIERLSIKLN